jgi:hypothetical protein
MGEMHHGFVMGLIPKPGGWSYHSAINLAPTNKHYI